ncbi:DNA adenine methylase [Lachnospiraceae bacterium OttesenSCG-928-J05]|nr:DNA adenine methylase [Lachnospiraceae bacterium OttesenSCG-928-J05]
MKNPLRYPGAKSKLYEYVRDLIVNENLTGCTFYEPFAGSATLSWLLLENRIVDNVRINEKDPLLYFFWEAVFNHTEELIQKIQRTEISIDTWHEQKRFRDESYIIDKECVDIGFSTLFLNRTNFSGILKANPIGGLNQKSDYKIDCRFNKDKVITQIRNIAKYKSKVSISNMDALLFMKSALRYKRNRKTFVYIDPPYYKEGPGLYRYFYRESQHEELAEFIKTKTYPWLISYDDVEEIRKLYNRRKCIKLYLDYSVKTSKKGEEILISNLEIPPMCNEEINGNLSEDLA